MSTVSQAKKAKHRNLISAVLWQFKYQEGCNRREWQKAQEKLKLWEVCAKDEKNGKAYLGTNGGEEGEGSVTCTKAQGKSKWYKERENLQTMKSGANAATMEEKRSDDEKRGKTRLLLKISVRVEWWKVRENIAGIEGKLSNDEKREKKPLLVLKRSVRVMKSAAKVKRTVPGKAHEERQYKFDKFCLVPHWLKFVNLSWRIRTMLRNDLSLEGRKPTHRWLHTIQLHEYVCFQQIFSTCHLVIRYTGAYTHPGKDKQVHKPLQPQDPHTNYSNWPPYSFFDNKLMEFDNSFFSPFGKHRWCSLLGGKFRETPSLNNPHVSITPAPHTLKWAWNV